MDELTVLVPSTTSASCRHGQRENVSVRLSLELDPLMLPEPLPEDEPEVENEDDPLDLLSDDPLLGDPLVDPDIDALTDCDLAFDNLRGNDTGGGMLGEKTAGIHYK